MHPGAMVRCRQTRKLESQNLNSTNLAASTTHAKPTGDLQRYAEVARREIFAWFYAQTSRLSRRSIDAMAAGLAYELQPSSSGRS